MKQRAICLLLCGILVTLLGACGKAEEDLTPVPPQVTSSETESAVDGLTHPTAKDSSTIQWLNALCAPALINAGNEDFDHFGGGLRTAGYVQQTADDLEKTWGITDKATADARLKWFQDHGQRGDYQSAVKQLDEAEFLELSDEDFVNRMMRDYNYDRTSSRAWLNTAEIYKEYGENAVDAWDGSLSVQVAGFCYIAGYYTFEEAVEKAVETGKALQQEYSSWDALMESYMAGLSFSSGRPITMDAEKGEGIFGAYVRLLEWESSPYEVDWNTVLSTAV